MTTKDLMIGDYVTFKDCQNNDAPTIVKIEGLGYQGRGGVEEAIVSIDGDAAFDLVEINEEYVGIPLAPEILKKNGWFYPGNYIPWMKMDNPYRELWGCSHSDGTFWLYASGDCDKDESFAEIRYVHELQHALKLCGIEKEITL